MHAFDLTHVALVLSLAFLGGLFLERLRQPALVGYIIVGAVIGPGLLGLQGDDTTVRWLAELAVVLLMFMIGLELDIQNFRSRIWRSLTVALLQVVFSLAAMYALSFVFDWTLAQTVLFGFIAALSSTAVAMTVLRGLGEEGTALGARAIGVLVAQDIIAIPMLLVISAFHGGADTGDIAALGLAVGGIVLSLFGIFELTTHPQWVARLERVLLAGTNQPVVAGLALCFGGAALSGSLGLSTAYGAFAMGMLLGNVGTLGTKYRKAMHPIYDLLMMVFFLSIGLLLNVKSLWAQALPVALILGAVVVLKTAGNALIARIMGAGTLDAYTLAAALGQIGEFSFVLAALGLSNGFISENTYQIALSVIALSLVISPVWLGFVRTYAQALAVRRAH